MTQRDELKTKILDFIERTPAFAAEQNDEPRFGQLALEVFAYQYEHNEPYRRLCDRRGQTPHTIQRWQDIPPVTTSSFKALPLFCHNPDQAAHVFHTSGTSQDRPGKHYFLDLDLYRAGSMKAFSAACLPDREKLPFLLIGPSAEFFPHSSLGQMYSWCLQYVGTPGSVTVFSPDGLDVARVRSWLQQQAESNQPVMILATSLALIELVLALEQEEGPRPLPAGSRILDTGGTKGRTHTIPRQELIRRTTELFDLPPAMLFNEYGMTEMSSQYYHTAFLAERFGDRDDRHFAPPWLRSMACDPETLAPLPEGSTGILRHFDLLNLDSVAMLQTEDLGQVVGRSLKLLGRLPGSEPRGCSLLSEEILR